VPYRGRAADHGLMLSTIMKAANRSACDLDVFFPCPCPCPNNSQPARGLVDICPVVCTVAPHRDEGTSLTGWEFAHPWAGVYFGCNGTKHRKASDGARHHLRDSATACGERRRRSEGVTRRARAESDSAAQTSQAKGIGKQASDPKVPQSAQELKPEFFGSHNDAAATVKTATRP
jgi:hypothetical protein